MILEGLVSTRTPHGQPHLAPMGPKILGDFAGLLLRPFPSSQTYQNLRQHPEGVFHITDDAALIVRMTLHRHRQIPALVPAAEVQVERLQDCCRAFEFVVQSMDDRQERVHVEAKIVASHHIRDFIGFHRARHALLEAAIIASRFQILPIGEIEEQLRQCRVIIQKTGDQEELSALEMIECEWQSARNERGAS